MCATITIPEGITAIKNDYIPANQHSTHDLVAGTYPIHATTISGGPVPAGERPYYLVVRVPYSGGEHTYYGQMPRHTEKRTLDAGEMHLRIYAYQSEFYVTTAAGWERFEIGAPAVELAG